MPTFTTIGTQYLVSSTPWPELDARNRAWYVPYMMEPYMRTSIFYRLVPWAVDMSQVHAKKAVFTERIPPQPDISELEFRGITVPRQYFDSRQMEVEFKTYGGGVQYHKWDQMIMQYAQQASKDPTLLNVGMPNTTLAGIIRKDLSVTMVQTLDILARNAFLSNALNRSFASDATGFHDIAAGDTFNPEVARTVKLGAGYSPYGSDGIFPAILSPAATYATKLLDHETNSYMRWKELSGPSSLLNYAIGQFEDVTWLENSHMVLWNVGTVLASASIIAAVEPGDGSPDPETTKVDDHWMTGSDEATHYIQLSSISDPSAAETGFKLNDRVTLCRELASANGALATAGAAVYNGAKNLDAQIVAIDYSNDRISLRFPVLNENFSTAISSGLYGFVVKARPVHCAIFLKRGLQDPGVGGVVMQPPSFYINEPIDARKAVWGFSWDAYLGYSMMDPDAFEVHFYAGHIHRGGSVLSL
jgi:hypothetical protein